MEPHLDERLKTIEKTLVENQRILLKIRRTQRNATLFRVFYWVCIVALTLGAFYYIQPYIEQISKFYSGLYETEDKLKTSIPDIKYLDSLLNQIKGN